MDITIPYKPAKIVKEFSLQQVLCIPVKGVI